MENDIKADNQNRVPSQNGVLEVQRSEKLETQPEQSANAKNNEVAASNSIYAVQESCVCKENYKDEISVVLSVIYGLIIVMLAIVFKVAESITDNPNLVSKEYQDILFSIAILWLLLFKLHNYYYERKGINLETVRSPHASNRWLKGVVALFGFAIIIKNSLEVIGTAEIKNHYCKKKMIYFSNFILHAFFIIGQVILLFFYAKVHIQEIKCISRFGVMHIMATNLAVWITVIADETNHALDLTPTNQISYSDCFTNYTALKSNMDIYCSNVSEIEKHFHQNVMNETSSPVSVEDKYEGLFSGNCSCHTPVCNVIRQAEKFLTPLLVEYCLVSSCLLYVLWTHIGMPTIHRGPVAKPSHKLYKSYKGVMMGALLLVATVIILTLLGTLDSGTDMNLKTYYTESHYLLIYDCFLLAFNLSILMACILGIYVYSVAKIKTKRSTVNLDIVLLFICVTGPLMVGLFSVFGLCVGPIETKLPGWEMSLVSSLAEVIVSVVQVLFAVHGLNKEPGTHENLNSFEDRQRPRTPTSFYNKNAEEIEFQVEDESINEYKMTNNEKRETSFSNSERKCSFDPSGSSVGPSNSASEIGNTSIDPTPSINLNRDVALGQKYSLEHRKSGSPFPSRIRIFLRDIMVFLVMCNTSLYIFLSLNGTVFRVYPYATEYFGDSAWTTLTSVTAPISIFLKLHFAACFFEIWSYA